MHSIRLRAAWIFEGGVALRRFNRPTGLDGAGGEGGDRVWLVWDGEVTSSELNGHPLGPGNCHDVTRRLLPGNELRLRGAAAAVTASVRLQIGPPSSAS